MEFQTNTFEKLSVEEKLTKCFKNADVLKFNMKEIGECANFCVKVIILKTQNDKEINENFFQSCQKLIDKNYQNVLEYSKIDAANYDKLLNEERMI